MSDKLVSLNAVINIAMQYCPDDDGSCSKADVDLREMLDELENLSPVEPSMSAVEYFKAYKRLCCEHVCWNGCPMMQYKDYDCETFQYNRPNEAVAIVEKWAREHPEVNDESGK